ncbi:MAG: ferric reductase-like transmembrane domain-containing protein [Candidatus Micrarchaeota archaeon]
MADEILSVQTSTSGRSLSLFAEIMAKKGFILKALLALIIFSLLQLANQYFFVPYQAIPDILIRGFALGGATLVGLSLLIGPLAVLMPKYNFVRRRRAIGVAGFTLIILHFSLVFSQRLGYSTKFIFGNLNPFANGLFMGSLAFTSLLLLFLTSSDWATRKLGQQNWKNLHRLIYVSFMLYILHALIMTQKNPERLFNPAGYLMLLVALLAALLQLFAYIKRIRMGRSRPIALYVGAFLILLYLAVFGLFFFARNLLTG